MSVFAEIRNGFECFCKCNILVFQIWVKKNSVPGSILVFGNVCFNIVVRINHDNVASRGAVGRTHTIVRLQARIRRKDGTENFGGSVYVLDGFPQQRHFVLWVSMCPINISLFSVSFVFSSFSFPATTPRATTPHLYCTGYHAQGYHAFTTTARLPRLCIYIPATTP